MRPILNAIGPDGLSFFAVSYVVVIFFLHAVMGLAVSSDAKRMLSNRRGLFLFGSFVWGFIVFVFGLAGLAAYWAIHHSNLRPVTTPPER